MGDFSRVVIIGLVGAFVAVVFFLEDLIADNLYDMDKLKQMGWVKIFFLMIANGVFGTVIMITSFYAIVQYNHEINQYLAGGISAMISFMGKDMIMVVHKVVKKKVGVE